MFRPQIQKTKILTLIAFINVVLVIYISKSITYNKYDNVDLRYKAVELMSNSVESIKKMKNVKISEEDYYKTGLIGVKESQITTIFEEQNIDNILKSKIITTHPNFAAFMVLLFEEIGLQDGDSIVVSMTGSLPGANIALLSACNSMGLKPMIFSSIGSSSWGANKENLTWVHIEDHLYENELIDFESIAISIGGENDLGDNISDEGIEIIESVIQKSIKNNKKIFINEEYLDESIKEKIKLLGNIEKYKAFVNIGGGASSLGQGIDKKFIKGGIISPLLKNEIQEIYYDMEKGNNYHDKFKESMAYGFLDNDIPFINIKNIELLVSEYGMTYLKDRDLNKINKGLLFYEIERFNIKSIWFALIASILVSIIVGIYSHLQIKERMKEDEIDSIL